VKIHFRCPDCDFPGEAVPGVGQWQCPRCNHLLALQTGSDPALPACLICGSPDLYRQKDFPHGLGMAILVLACLTSTVTYGLHLFYVTWAILIGSALFDGLLYLWVKDVVVCYSCHARFRGVTADPPHPPFELTVHERYRQERLRLHGK
jgi:hypothetical protein